MDAIILPKKTRVRTIVDATLTSVKLDYNLNVEIKLILIIINKKNSSKKILQVYI